MYICIICVYVSVYVYLSYVMSACLCVCVIAHPLKRGRIDLDAEGRSLALFVRSWYVFLSSSSSSSYPSRRFRRRSSRANSGFSCHRFFSFPPVSLLSFLARSFSCAGGGSRVGVCARAPLIARPPSAISSRSRSWRGPSSCSNPLVTLEQAKQRRIFFFVQWLFRFYFSRGCLHYSSI